MKYDFKKQDNSVTITFKVEGTDWEKALTEAYNRTKGKYDIQGFRKGHAPRNVIEKMYGKGAFLEEAFDGSVNACYKEVLAKEKGFEPISQPEVDLVALDEKGMEATIKVECMPIFTLGQYRDLEVKRVKHTVSAKDVDAEIERGRLHYAEDKEVERASKLGDVVTIDFVGTVNGEKFEGGSAVNYQLELGSKSFIEGFEEQLVGKKAGDKVKVKASFPANYGAAALAGKAAVFDTTVTKVSEKILPELNDEYAKKFGDFKNFAAYKKDVEAQLVKVAEDNSKAATENALIDAIVKNTKVEVPKFLIEEQQDAIMKDLEMRLMYQGLNLEGYAQYMNLSVDDIRASKVKDAHAIAKTKLVLEAIVKAEKMKVSDADMDKELTILAKKADKTLEDYKKTIQPRQLDFIANDILMKKLIALMHKYNKIVD